MSDQPLKAAVLFDLDGTLLDTAADFAAVLNAMRADHDLPPLPFAAVREVVSDGARALIRLGFDKREGDDGFALLLQELLDRYEQHLAVETGLFEGLDEMLQWLERRDTPWGIVTNKPLRYAEKILQQLALDKRCATLICPDHVAERKPDPEGLHLALQQTRSDPTKSIYVGDHLRDIEAGINAGMHTIACRWGYIHADDRCENWGAHRIAEDGDHLLQLLTEHLA